MKKTALTVIALPLLLLIFLSTPAFALTKILNIRHWTAPDHTRVVVDTSAEAHINVKEEEGKIVVEFEKAVVSPDVLKEYVLEKPAVRKVSVISLSSDRVRIEVYIARSVQPRVFTLGKILDKPHRVVIDANIPEVEEQETVERKKVKKREKKKIIVIDPGHGGEDPGAIGPRGTKEKDIVLKISRALRDKLVERGYKVLLTREGDYYVPFKKRLKIARESNADLFISIHADACNSRSVQGASVYCLSTKGASSEAARLLAESQNLSDIIGGVPNGRNNDETDSIILNMLQTETINQSKSFGAMVLENIKKVNRLKFSKVQEAPFRVLKLPDITSLLVETAYLSNAHEEALLRTRAYQDDMAWAIAATVTHYIPSPYLAQFEEKDGAYEPLSKKAAHKRESFFYKVERGDRLEKIAQRFGTTVQVLMKENNIRLKNRIYVGQKLRILGAAVATASSHPFHVVQRGETLKGIAEKYGTTALHVAKLNAIESPNRIYVGQKLRLADEPKTGTEESAREDKKTATTYVVKRGDRLGDIAKKFSTTVQDLMRLNTVKSQNRIYVGQKLAIADDTPKTNSSSNAKKEEVYVVKKGDTLEIIAQRYGKLTSELATMNRLKSKNKIYAGQKLRIPGE